MTNKIIIIEDELPIQLFITELIKETMPDANIIAACTSVSEAVKAIQAFKPDLVFLDIEIIGGSGFDVLQQTRDLGFEVIFITAYEDYALKAIKANALDYILKPILKKEFEEACQRFQDRKQTLTQGKSIIVEGRLSTKRINLNDIRWIEIKKGFCVFHTSEGDIHSTSGINSYLNDLNDYFLRIHRSYVVNLKRTKTLDLSKGASLILDNDQCLPISFRRKKIVIEKFKAIRT